MELNAFWAALLRRWYLTVAGVALAIAITALMVVRIGPTYKAEGALLLFPPTTTIKNGTTVETQGNPYLMLGGLSQARDIVIRSLDSRSAKKQFEEQEPLATYEVTPDFSTSGPIIVIDVSAPSQSAAVAGLKTVMSTVPGTLKALQSGLDLPQSAYITSRKLTADTIPEVVRSGQIRSGIVVGVVVMALTLFLLALLDGLLESRPSKGTRRGGRHTSRLADLEEPTWAPSTKDRSRSEPVADGHDTAHITTTSR